MTQPPPSGAWHCLSCKALLVLRFETTYQCPACGVWRRVADWERPSAVTLEAFL